MVQKFFDGFHKQFMLKERFRQTSAIHDMSELSDVIAGCNRCKTKN